MTKLKCLKYLFVFGLFLPGLVFASIYKYTLDINSFHGSCVPSKMHVSPFNSVISINTVTNELLVEDCGLKNCKVTIQNHRAIFRFDVTQHMNYMKGTSTFTVLDYEKPVTRSSNLSISMDGHKAVCKTSGNFVPVA